MDLRLSHGDSVQDSESLSSVVSRGNVFGQHQRCDGFARRTDVPGLRRTVTDLQDDSFGIKQVFRRLRLVLDQVDQVAITSVVDPQAERLVGIGELSGFIDPIAPPSEDNDCHTSIMGRLVHIFRVVAIIPSML